VERREAGRLGSVWLLVCFLTGCMPVVVPIEPAAPGPMPGPNLIVDVTNKSDRGFPVAYEFESEDSAGGGDGTVMACERSIVPLALVQGDYAIAVDGETVFEGSVPAGVPDESWYMVRLIVEPDGGVEVVGPAILPRMPEPFTRPIAACG
jgi:hypothetical protein